MDNSALSDDLFVSENCPKFCFVISQESRLRLGSVLKYITAKYEVDYNDIFILGTNRSEEEEQLVAGRFFTVTEFFLHICDTFKLYDKKNIHYFGSDDSLVVLQLCLAERNKKDTGRFEVDETYVLDTYDELTEMRLKINESEANSNERTSYLQDVLKEYETYRDSMNGIDEIQLYHAMRTYLETPKNKELILGRLVLVITDISESNIQKEMLQLLVHRNTICSLQVETDLNESDSPETGELYDETVKQIRCEWLTIKDIFNTHIQQNESFTKESFTKLFMERAILAYFRLIGNTRDEVALATALTSMEKEFSNEAFTALKKMAKTQELPMYQAAISLVLKLKLGGKSYAPDQNCPLMSFLPEITAFTELMQRIQTFIEDYDTPTAIQNIIRSLKCHVNKTCNPNLHSTTVEMAVQHLESLVSSTIRQADLNVWNIVEDSEKRSVIIGQPTVDIICKLCNKFGALSKCRRNATFLTDNFSSQKTPVRLFSVLSLFRSPDVTSTLSDVPVLSKKRHVAASSNQDKIRVNESVAECRTIKVPKESTLPKETTTLNDVEVHSDKTPQKQTAFKRTALAEINFENPKRQRSLNLKGNVGKCDKKRKKPVLIRGQQLMTKFLRM